MKPMIRSTDLLFSWSLKFRNSDTVTEGLVMKQNAMQNTKTACDGGISVEMIYFLFIHSMESGSLSLHSTECGRLSISVQ